MYFITKGGGGAMLNSAAVLKKGPDSVPKVLLQAKKESVIQAFGKGKPWDKAWDKGPWDRGHWANRK